jgi:hypothetical protein
MVASNDPAPRDAQSDGSTGPGCAWTAGLILGAIASIGLLEFGIYGLAFAAISLGLIAWKGPRAVATAGFITGLGGTWAFLFGRVMVSCAGQNAEAAGSCDAGNIGAWVLGSAMVLCVGVVASVIVARRVR